jgi:molybdate transport system substrate-binding protein
VRRRAVGAAILLAVGVLGFGTACAASADDAPAGAASGDTTTGAGTIGGAPVRGKTLSGSITVLAAASLADVFEEIGLAFEAAHPSVEVTFSFGASSSLAAQALAGAPADVLATASEATMATVVDGGAAADAVAFARNTMTIAVPADNPAGIAGLADLAGADVRLAVCQEQVPCGAAAREVLANAGLAVTPATLEPDVRSVLSKVTLGEVDAGIVYVTDVAGDDVTAVPVPDEVNATTTYPIAALAGSAHRDVAAAFVAAVLSAEGRAALADAGFGAP